MLKLMRRNITKKQTYELIDRIREEVPGIHLRTTLMVGHPGETEEDIQELKEFIRKEKFERLGAFTYSHEEGTFAYQNYEDEISEEEKLQRLDKIMELQQQISFELNQSKIGKVFKVMIDRVEGEYYVGRTEFDSPEVDSEVLIPISNKNIKIGEFSNIKIVDALDFDLYGISVVD